MFSARAALNQALANAQANGRGVTAGEQQQELAQARDAANAAQATVVQLEREIARAPVDGTVDAVNANPGEYPSGREIFTIEQIDRVYAILPASSAQVLQIHQGAAATVQTPAAKRHLTGTVVAILDQIQPGTTNFTAKVLLSNPDEALHAGMPVTASVDEPPLRGIVIPITAFVDDTHSSVYAVRDGVVHEQSVTELEDDGTNAVVSGLTAGSAIVKDVSSVNVENGDRVEAQPDARVVAAGRAARRARSDAFWTLRGQGAPYSARW